MKPIALPNYLDLLLERPYSKENSRLIDLYLAWQANKSCEWVEFAPEDFWIWIDLLRFYNVWLKEAKSSISFATYLLEVQRELNSEFLSRAIEWLGRTAK